MWHTRWQHGLAGIQALDAKEKMVTWQAPMPSFILLPWKLKALEKHTHTHISSLIYVYNICICVIIYIYLSPISSNFLPRYPRASLSPVGQGVHHSWPKEALSLTTVLTSKENARCRIWIHFLVHWISLTYVSCIKMWTFSFKWNWKSFYCKNCSTSTTLQAVVESH